MTEQEAIKLWCPLSRVAVGIHTAAVNRNADGRPPQTCKCIASACMAWVTDHTGQQGYCGALRS